MADRSTEIIFVLNVELTDELNTNGHLYNYIDLQFSFSILYLHTAYCLLFSNLDVFDCFIVSWDLGIKLLSLSGNLAGKINVIMVEEELME